MLAEIGDNKTRFADARGSKAYAGALPITRASGKRSGITRRWVKNNRLNHAGYLTAFSSITASPGAKAHYRRRRDDHGDWHAAAQRNLFNRMLGQPYHCLQHHTLFQPLLPLQPTAITSAMLFLSQGWRTRDRADHWVDLGPQPARPS